MAIFRQYIAPLLILLIFLLALAAVSFRSFLPEGMSGPAPVDDVSGIFPGLEQVALGMGQTMNQSMDHGNPTA